MLEALLFDDASERLEPRPNGANPRHPSKERYVFNPRLGNIAGPEVRLGYTGCHCEAECKIREGERMSLEGTSKRVTKRVCSIANLSTSCVCQVGATAEGHQQFDELALPFQNGLALPAHAGATHPPQSPRVLRMNSIREDSVEIHYFSTNR